MNINISARFLIILFLLVSMSLIFTNCGDDNPSEPPAPILTKIVVNSEVDSSAIVGANVVLYNATNGESVSREFSGNDGIAKWEYLPMEDIL